MNAKLPTVAIETDDGTVLINEIDYNPDKHKLVKGEPTPVKTDEQVKMLVVKTGRKYLIVAESGDKIEVEGIDAKGYGSEADAWAAIMALSAS